jgi:hypothetical protein
VGGDSARKGSPVLDDGVEKLLETPQMICQVRHHRRGWTPFPRLAALVGIPGSPAKVVVGREDGPGGGQTLELLREAQGQRGEPFHKRADRQVVPFDIRRANFPPAKFPLDDPAVGSDYLARRVRQAGVAEILDDHPVLGVWSER